MKELSFSIATTIERVFDSQDECDKDESEMIDMGFEVVENKHEDYQFYRKYSNTIY